MLWAAKGLWGLFDEKAATFLTCCSYSIYLFVIKHAMKLIPKYLILRVLNLYLPILGEEK